MTILAFDNLFTTPAMHAVFITLAHSLWIGAVMAVVAGLIMMLTKKTGPQVRYNLLTALMALFIIGMLSVFYYAFTKELRTVDEVSKTIITSHEAVNFQINIVQQKNVFDAFISFMQANAGIIVWIWLMIICYKCVRLISGLDH